ncbi:MAG: site-2 protease family protein [Methanosphaera sp. SHI613]|jgi:Zn-dependent protease|nr:MAG: site-2 protease family protein [Methanosphaera sp. SHI613]
MYEFTTREKIGLAISFIVLSIAFAISNVKLDVHGFISILPIIMVGVAVGFISRELGHKIVANKYGLRAEFRFWPIGLLIALVTSFFGMVFAFIGEVKIYSDDLTDEIAGRIACAGPMANIFWALMFLVIAVLTAPFKSYSHIIELVFLIAGTGYSVNSFLAAFNMIPVYTLDGLKVIKWNVGVWLIVFAVSVAMMLLSIIIGVENMVMMIITLNP